MAIRIGEVAERSGTSTTAIRYYESIGLLEAPQRSDAGYRRYADRVVEEVLFIRKAQAVGFSLDDLREILTLARSGRRPCNRVRTIAERHLRAVGQRIEDLTRFRAQLAAHLDQWTREGTARPGPAICGWVEDIDESVLTRRAEHETLRQRANGSTPSRKTKKEH